MTIKVDLHNHLRTFSTMKNFNKVIDIASDRIGSGGILGVTNFEDTRFEDFTNLSGYERENHENFCYIPEKDFYVLKTQEIPTKQGHLLALATPRDKQVEGYRTLEDSIKGIKDYGGLTILDHPFGHNGSGNYVKENLHLLNQIDGIEVHNGEIALPILRKNPRDANKKAQKFYREIREYFPHLSAIVSSDGHSLYEIGSSYTEIDNVNFKDRETLVQSLKENLETPKGYKVHNSYIGALEHSLIISAFILFSKLGINIDPYHWENSKPNL